MLPKPVQFRTVLCASVMALLSVACATTGGGEAGSSNANNARSALNALKADAALSGLAPAAMQEAEAAVRRAEMAGSRDDTEREHLGYLAEVKVEIARAEAERKQAEARTQALAVEREQQEIAARERAAEEQARAEAARRAEQDALRAEMEALKFKEVERGFVLTLSGGTLFASGKWDIKPGVAKNLDRVAEFLVKYPERKVTIEGHTDSQGNDDYNLKLSQRRADSVTKYLVGHGVAPERITSVGKGESLPVADNKTAEGRQHNRRVEIVIAD